MNIFFGGSSSGLKKDPSSYKRISDCLKKLNVSLINDWINNDLDKKLLPSESYKNTHNAIKTVQGVVLEATVQTSGLGQQLEIALANNVPVLIITKDEKTQFGNFINPEKQKLTTVKTYNDDNLNKLLKDFIEQIGKNYSFARFNLVIGKDLNNYLENKAKSNKTNKTEEIRRLIIEDMKRKLSTG